ncbi:MAG: hypothetical protein JWL81_891 [Verrucomicrobiales bacterium]|nr:hypothetical protein [Verrucomicrobiales bacterium]
MLYSRVAVLYYSPMNQGNDPLDSCGTCDWPHAPPHRLGGAGVYFVTARTLGCIAYFNTPYRLDRALAALLGLADRYGWRLEAWAFLSNHYHFIAHSPSSESGGTTLALFLKHLHAELTRTINREDGVTGRKIWHNYRETHLTWHKSYLARLNYTHHNPVHHRLVALAEDYPWCSAHRFAQSVTPAWAKTIRSFAYDQIAEEDGDNL